MKNFNIKEIQTLAQKNEINYLSLVKKLNIDRKFNKEFSIFLNEMLKKNLLFCKNDFYFYKKEAIKIKGEFSLNNRGFGFIKTENEESYFVPKFYTLNSLDGDIVEATCFQEENKEGLFCAINKILERSDKQYFGYIKVNNGFFDFTPFDSKIQSRFRWFKKYSFFPHEVVKVKIIEIKNNYIIIDLVDRFGDLNSPFKDIELAIEKSEVNHIFSKEVLEKAKQIPQDIKNENIENRVDLRNEVIVTIDGEDTKDFDDAISIKKTENGEFILSVHIADVSYYVKENDDVDLEARKRGTSVYLADRVIPMLPFELSTGICSLNPKVDRFTITMECQINSKGENTWVKFYPSIINSYKRLTYNQVNDFYEGKIDFDENINTLLNNAKELAEIIRKYKKGQGFIDFEFEESKVILDENGKTIDIVIRDRNTSENMIEDFMVRANENIAEFMSKKGLPFIYRIHPVPEAEKIDSFNHILKSLNIDVKIPYTDSPIIFANVMEKIKDINFDNFIKINLLRTMQKAIYSDKNIGHFGLASKFYTHFTSPIRRYPDLIVHRLLREFIFENKKENIDYFKNELEEISLKNSLSEQSAISLEREVLGIKIAEFYEDKINEEFDAQIVSIKKFGFFVEMKNGSSALVHVSTLPGIDYEMDENEIFLKNKDNVFKVGQWVKIKIESVSKFEGKINAILK
ncbi:ribonuclease R [Mesomycoplasma molare]|uniref:Ribonuclease R n=1 Tax=Mesomycoplasma molare TaxID=171288 RepID=A0ABY5TUE3_9BACT|nr:ribonuclease R [Mesomycoplasma molare]UWD34273.1 ribonuclease R [Mesomycoplasma molare]